MLHENDFHESSLFVTLTYDDDHLPPGSTLVKKDFQMFLKRLRYFIEPRQIKYFACGEYGSETLRPHYHAIIFGLSNLDEPIISKAWTLGYNYVGSVTNDSINYVSGYIQKKLDGPMAKAVYGSAKLIPFQLMSKGLGKQYVEKNREQLLQKIGLTVKGEEVSLPRYYKKILEVPTEVLYEKSLKHGENVKKILLARGIPEEQHEEYKARVARSQHEKNIRAKVALKERKKL